MSSMKVSLSPEIETYISENPEFVEVLKAFGETMQTYNEALQAMGVGQSAQIISGTTSAAEDLDVKSASTKYFKLTGTS